jgi:3-hydroxyisobutyrate dehydrogenase-like beta-hydroxyacid dehydrogenase
MDIEKRRVGLVGAGLLGSALAERLAANGWSLTGYDVNPRQLQGFPGKTVGSASGVAAECSLVLLSLPDSKVASEVLAKITEALREGSTVIDTTTGDPEEMAGLGARLASHGIRYLDATVGGNSRQVRAGEVIILAGGEEGVFAECAELFACFAKEAFYVGPWGSGARMKLVLNLVLGLHRAVLAEGLHFGARCGFDPARVLEVLKAGPAYSRVMDLKGDKMVARDYEVEARLGQHLKDVRLILEEGERTGAALPLSTVHRTLLERAEALGFGGADNSAVMEAFAESVE